MGTFEALFIAQSPTTSPGGAAALYDGLPADVAGLRDVVQGVLVHAHWAGSYGLELDAARREEVQLRTVARQLERIVELDPRPLAEPRPAERRLVGNCRDFAVLLTSMLRHAGVPARARCGFARYFDPGMSVDHWVCEYWAADARRWVLADAQLDGFQRDALGIAFDPLDVPRDTFATGGAAWQACRAHEADPDAFGIDDMTGLWFVRGDLVRDAASLLGTETLPWDGWGIIDVDDGDLRADDLALLDRVADLTDGDVPDLEGLRRLFEADDRLRVPATITSYTEEGRRLVELTST